MLEVVDQKWEIIEEDLNDVEDGEELFQANRICAF